MLNKLFLFLLLLLSTQIVLAKSIRVMSYNVQNLFDTVHDQNKDDWTFLPISNPNKATECQKVTVEHYQKECLETDWTPEKLEIKISQIDKLIKSLPQLPDILALIEVENSNVVDKLRKKLGYQKLIITNSPDERGVDVAILYNTSIDLVFVDSKEHVLVTSRNGITSPTRNILEVNFKLRGKPFTLYANHWPSQQSGPNSRMSSAAQLLEIVKSQLSKADAKVMMVGDFNVTDIEKPNPITDILTKNTGLIDIYTKLTSSAKSRLPPGTFFYGWDFSWNRLDRVIVNEGFLRGIPSVKPANFSVYTPSFITREYEQKNQERPHFGEKMISPWKYWHNAFSADKAGFSDHYPVFIDIEI